MTTNFDIMDHNTNMHCSKRLFYFQFGGVINLLATHSLSQTWKEYVVEWCKQLAMMSKSHQKVLLCIVLIL